MGTYACPENCEEVYTNAFLPAVHDGTNLKHLCNAKKVYATSPLLSMWPLHCALVVYTHTTPVSTARDGHGAALQFC